jgi:hypothetical protein
MILQSINRDRKEMQTTYTFCEDTVSDLHKDAYGFRPKGDFWTYWEGASNDQKQELWDSMYGTMQRTLELERELQDEAVVKFENTLASMMHLGARSKEMAIHWLHEAHNTNGDNEYLDYMLNVPYGTVKKTLAV